MPLALILPWGIKGSMILTYYDNLWLDAKKGAYSLYLFSTYSRPGYCTVPCASLSACFLYLILSFRLSWSAAFEPTLSCQRFFFSFHPSLLRFPHRGYKSCAVSCASSPLPHLRVWFSLPLFHKMRRFRLVLVCVDHIQWSAQIYCTV